jgi:hypothetical protein
MPANAFSMWWHFPFLLMNYHRFQCGFSFHVPAIHIRLVGWASIYHWFFCSCNKQQDWLLLIFLQAPRWIVTRFSEQCMNNTGPLTYRRLFGISDNLITVE